MPRIAADTGNGGTSCTARETSDAVSGFLSATMADLIGRCANHRFAQKSLEELQRLKSVVEIAEVNLGPEDRPIRNVKRRIGTATINQLIADYEAGIHTPELVTKYALSKTSVLKILRDNHVTIRRQSMTPEQIAEAIQHYEDGKSLSATAREIDIPKQSVRNALLKAGVTMRPSTRSQDATRSEQPEGSSAPTFL